MKEIKEKEILEDDVIDTRIWFQESEEPKQKMSLLDGFLSRINGRKIVKNDLSL